MRVAKKTVLQDVVMVGAGPVNTECKKHVDDSTCVIQIILHTLLRATLLDNIPLQR